MDIFQQAENTSNHNWLISWITKNNPLRILRLDKDIWDAKLPLPHDFQFGPKALLFERDSKLTQNLMQFWRLENVQSKTLSNNLLQKSFHSKPFWSLEDEWPLGVLIKDYWFLNLNLQNKLSLSKVKRTGWPWPFINYIHFLKRRAL